jgi:hypothetical protein
MSTKNSLVGRERFMRKQYRRIDEHHEELGLGRVCVLCRVGVPGGNPIATAHHEIVPKSELPGRANWETLFAPENIALACPVHHDQFQPLRLLWLKAMVAAQLVKPEQYRVPPFLGYWDDAPYPPTFECLGQYGYGSAYFASVHPMLGSLKRLYQIAHPEFEERRFCDYCKRKARCRSLTPRPV